MVTHLLAMQKMRVRFSLDALNNSGCGKSLGFRVLRKYEDVGSNPAILTGVAFRSTVLPFAPRKLQCRKATFAERKATFLIRCSQLGKAAAC